MTEEEKLLQAEKLMAAGVISLEDYNLVVRRIRQRVRRARLFELLFAGVQAVTWLLLAAAVAEFVFRVVTR